MVGFDIELPQQRLQIQQRRKILRSLRILTPRLLTRLARHLPAAVVCTKASIMAPTPTAPAPTSQLNLQPLKSFPERPVSTALAYTP